MRADFASSEAEIYDASDDGSQDVGTVLEEICRKSIQTGLLVRTITDELNYFIYSLSFITSLSSQPKKYITPPWSNLQQTILGVNGTR